jgi:hypothetical protein
MTQPAKKGWDQYLMASVFKKEATYAAGVTHTSVTSCSFKGFDFDPGYADTITSDKDEITGKEHGYDQEITAYGNNPTLKFARVRPNDFAAFAALVMGSTTPSQDASLTAYRHKNIPIADGSDLSSISIVHKIGAIQTEYKGVKGNTLKLSGEAGGFLSMDVGMMASGQRATNAASFAATITESWMKVDQLKFFLESGANISIGATPTQGSEDISSATPDDFSIRGKSFEFGWDNKMVGQPGFGGAGYLQDAVYERRGASFKSTIQFASAAEIAYFTAQDACAIELDFKAAALIAVGGAFYYGASIIIPRAKIKTYPQPKGGVNDSLTQDFDFEVFEDGTNPPVIIYNYTAQAAYLAAP